MGRNPPRKTAISTTGPRHRQRRYTVCGRPGPARWRCDRRVRERVPTLRHALVVQRLQRLALLQAVRLDDPAGLVARRAGTIV